MRQTIDHTVPTAAGLTTAGLTTAGLTTAGLTPALEADCECSCSNVTRPKAHDDGYVPVAEDLSKTADHPRRAKFGIDPVALGLGSIVFGWIGANAPAFVVLPALAISLVGVGVASWITSRSKRA